MDVSFRTRQLEQCYLDSAKAIRLWGNELARKYIQRVNILRAVKNLPDLRGLPGLRCHPLKGERAGQWAINLDRLNRLVFTLVEGNLEVICIEEVSKHYGD